MNYYILTFAIILIIIIAVCSLRGDSNVMEAFRRRRRRRKRRKRKLFKGIRKIFKRKLKNRRKRRRMKLAQKIKALLAQKIKALKIRNKAKIMKLRGRVKTYKQLHNSSKLIQRN